jgi:glucokinase
MSGKLYVGLDVGGTAIKAGVCNEEGQLLHTFEGPTENEKGSDRVMANMARYARTVVEQMSASWDDVAGVGVGVPGFLDIQNGVLLTSPNLVLRNAPLTSYLTEQLGKPVLINNDANVAALGEAWAGAGRGVSDCVMYTLGTGVGGGIIVGGRVVVGFNAMAGELGHISIVPDLEAIQCGCGKKGCLETVSSATGIIRMAKDAVARGELSRLAHLETITAKDVIDLAKAGDETAARIVQRAAHYLGKSMALVSVVVNPQRFIIGGGVAKAGEYLFGLIREAYHKHALEAAAKGVEIVPAELGNNAGVVGAAGLILRS